ncbi:hypothetical protein CI238_05531 [Colletotrichum incanum]|uniref:Uncharacterized protein n=1 Tax=Colletotrichum incanum TaxID=1573173 RepID=A0A161WN14_COLIC|nr:hypothetical protein CI238_05531 [Colletotrichum incanum]
MPLAAVGAASSKDLGSFPTRNEQVAPLSSALLRSASRVCMPHLVFKDMRSDDQRQLGVAFLGLTGHVLRQ